MTSTFKLVEDRESLANAPVIYCNYAGVRAGAGQVYVTIGQRYDHLAPIDSEGVGEIPVIAQAVIIIEPNVAKQLAQILSQGDSGEQLAGKSQE